MTPKPKTPTASGISRLLASAGFDRAARADQVGINRASLGFAVSADITRSGAVLVRHCFEPEGESVTRRLVMLTWYASAIIAAGWSVEQREHDLIVTAKED